MYNGITISPGRHDDTFEPTDSIIPHPSCPNIDGNIPSGSLPDNVYLYELNQLYIFLKDGKWNIYEILDIPSASNENKDSLIPNWHYPSDHFSIMAKLVWK